MNLKNVFYATEILEISRRKCEKDRLANINALALTERSSTNQPFLVRQHKIFEQKTQQSNKGMKGNENMQMNMNCCMGVKFILHAILCLYIYFRCNYYAAKILFNNSTATIYRTLSIINSFVCLSQPFQLFQNLLYFLAQMNVFILLALIQMLYDDIIYQRKKWF